MSSDDTVVNRQFPTFVLSIGRLVFRLQIAAGLVVLAVIGGSLIPIDDARMIPGSDGFKHVIAYALLCFFSMRALRGVVHMPMIPLGCLAFGFVLELLQPFFGRAFEINDLVANGAGVMLGCVAVWLVRSRLRHPGDSSSA